MCKIRVNISMCIGCRVRASREGEVENTWSVSVKNLKHISHDPAFPLFSICVKVVILKF